MIPFRAARSFLQRWKRLNHPLSTLHLIKEARANHHRRCEDTLGPAHASRHGIAMTVGKIMIALFLWFFSIDTLTTICQHTNDKAMEKVWKTRHTHPDGRVYYKVCCMHMHAYIHISMRMHGRTCIQSHTYMHSCDHINAHIGP